MSETTTTIYINHDDHDDVLTENDVESRFDDFLDESYGLVKVMGYEYDHSRVAKLIDPIAYRQGVLDYIDSSYHEAHIPDEIWRAEFGDQGVTAWITEEMANQ